MTTSNVAHTLSINDMNLYYEVHGEGEPLLILHGFTGSGAGLATMFSELSKKHQLIIPDLRGHGRSTNPSKQFTFHQAALDIFALLEHLNMNQCKGIGFSGGGCTLLQMAYLQPEKIKSMVMVSATPYFPEQARNVIRQFTATNKTDADWDAMRKIHLQGDEQIKMIWQQASDMANSTDDMNFNQEKLAKIKAKTLIVQGDHDPLYPIDTTIELFKGIAHSHLWIIPGSGHGPIDASNVKQFIDYVERFI